MFLKRFLYLLLLIPIGLAAQDKGVHFEHDLSWSQVKAKAKAENKYIFMDCSTTWCVNCAYMTSTIFPMEEMGTFFNDRFISVHVQMDSTAQDPENIKRWYADVRVIKSKYPISGYPTFLYFSPDGELVHRVLGSAEAKEFITKSASALDPDKQLYTLLKKYKQPGSYNAAALRDLSLAYLDGGDGKDASIYSAKYLDGQKDLFTKENILFMVRMLSDKYNRNIQKEKSFQVFVRHGAKIDLVMGKGFVAGKVSEIIAREDVYPFLRSDSLPDWHALQAAVARKYPGYAEEPVALGKLFYYTFKGDNGDGKLRQQQVAEVIDYMAKYGGQASPERKNSCAMTVFLYSPDVNILTQALEWSKSSLENNGDNTVYLDTYANILYKLGRNEEAMALEQKVVNLTPLNNGRPGYQDKLDKMKKGERTWIGLAARDKGTYFEHGLNWQEVKDKAKKENKYLLVDCYTTWCGICTEMVNTVFPQEKVGEFLNKNFISVKIQFDKTEKDNEAVKKYYPAAEELDGDYGVQAYPTFLIFSPSGEIVHRIVGASKAEEFIAEVQKSLTPETQYYTLIRKIETEKSPALLKQMALSTADDNDQKTADRLAAAYIGTQSDVYTRDNLRFIIQFATSSRSPGFQIVLKDAEKVDAALGKGTAAGIIAGVIKKEKVDLKGLGSSINIDSLVKVVAAQKLKETIMKEEVSPAVYQSAKPDWTAIQAAVNRKYPGYGEEMVVKGKILYYGSMINVTGDYNSMINVIAAYMDKYGSEVTPEDMNSYARMVFEYSPDRSLLQKALEWSKITLAYNDDNPVYLNTYAGILYKLGKKEDAIAVEQKVMSLVPIGKAGMIQEKIDKMKRGEKITPLGLQAQEQGIHFENDLSWQQVKARAKAENKYIFMDCYATWCGPCKEMNTTVFSQKEVGDFFNTRFVNVAVQMDKTPADADYIRRWYADAAVIEKAGDISLLPSYLFFSPDGLLVHKIVGGSEATAFIAKAADALDPDKQYYTLINRAKLALHTHKGLFTKKILSVINDFCIKDSRDQYFNFFIKQPAKIDQVMGKGYAAVKPREILFREEVFPHLSGSVGPDWNVLQAALVRKYPVYAKELIAQGKVAYYTFHAGNRDSVFQRQLVTEIFTYMTQYGRQATPGQLNSYAFMLFQYDADRDKLEQALEWSKRSLINNDNNYNYLATYARLLYKLGKKEEAIAVEEKLVDLVPLLNGGQSFRDELDKMRRGEKTWTWGNNPEPRREGGMP